MELWIPITIFAAFMQNLRSAMQKHLKGQFSTNGASFSRFIYAAPLAVFLWAVLITFGGYALPGFSTPFWGYAMLGGIGQIIATSLLVSLFSYRNFAVGTAFSKTETIQTALFGLVLLGETASPLALAAIMVSLIGVLMISIPNGSGISIDHKAGIGILSGAAFGISAVSYRAASLSLADGDALIRAATTLAFVSVFQTLVMGAWIVWREPGQVTAVLRAWRIAGWVGLTGMLGSLGWFTAMTLQSAAYVRALGQVELIFTIAASYIIFKERPTKREIFGVLLVACGIVGLLTAP